MILPIKINNECNENIYAFNLFLWIPKHVRNQISENEVEQNLMWFVL